MNGALLHRLLCPLLLVGAPLVGAWLGGLPREVLLEFPPRTIHHTPAPYSTPVWIGYALLIAAATTPLIVRLLRAPRATPLPPRGRPGPAGWLVAGLLLTGAAWTLAWSRFAWFRPLQMHTFLPLWVGFTLTVNGLARWRGGRAPWLEGPDRFPGLFAASALFWWYFEFLNRFVQNWHYSEESYTAFQYFFLATLSFSTVLPAVVSLTVYLQGTGPVHRAFAAWRPLRPARPRLAAFLAVGLGTAALAAIGLLPDRLFALLWVAPLAVMVGLAQLTGRPHVLRGLARGDWRLPVAAAGAALICGFFWELWNWHSLARWRYTVPYVNTLHLFEMPLLGFAGYLPFGLECVQAAMLFGLWERER